MTAVNYEYCFYWYLQQDGTISHEIRLTGILSTSLLTPGEAAAGGGGDGGDGSSNGSSGGGGGGGGEEGEESVIGGRGSGSRFGTMVADGVNAAAHQVGWMKGGEGRELF